MHRFSFGESVHYRGKNKQIEYLLIGLLTFIDAQVDTP
jgi:hypothetical protein